MDLLIGFDPGYRISETEFNEGKKTKKAQHSNDHKMEEKKETKDDIDSMYCTIVDRNSGFYENFGEVLRQNPSSKTGSHASVVIKVISQCSNNLIV